MQPFSKRQKAIQRAKATIKKKGKSPQKKSFGVVGTYLDSLSRSPASYQARFPYANHAWVYTAATTIATVAAQAHYKIFHENEKAKERRKKEAKYFGRSFRERYGATRRAIARYSSIGATERLFKTSNSLMEDPDHELNVLLDRPNPYQDRASYEIVTNLWAALRGEFFAIKTLEDGGIIAPDETPVELWPISPDCFKERLTPSGEFVGWSVSTPKYFPGPKKSYLFAPHEVLHVITRPNPSNPLRGQSPISAVASSIETDLLAKVHNRSLVENDAIPKGIIVNESGWADDGDDGDTEADMRRKWDEFYKGELKSGRIGFLSGGLKFLPIGLSPQDMQFMEQYSVDRQEVLSAMGAFPSTVGLSEFTNYSTALVQDNGFWNKTILPLLMAKEIAYDRELLFQEPDSIVGIYDVRNIEALRAGIKDKIEIAKEMCTDALHAPPRIAFETVGLQVNRYEGDDEGFVSLHLQTVDYALENPPEEEEVSDNEPDTNIPESEPVDDNDGKSLSEVKKRRILALLYTSITEEKSLKFHWGIAKNLGIVLDKKLKIHCQTFKDNATLSEKMTFCEKSVKLFSGLYSRTAK